MPLSYLKRSDRRRQRSFAMLPTMRSPTTCDPFSTYAAGLVGGCAICTSVGRNSSVRASERRLCERGGTGGEVGCGPRDWVLTTSAKDGAERRRPSAIKRRGSATARLGHRLGAKRRGSASAKAGMSSSSIFSPMGAAMSARVSSGCSSSGHPVRASDARRAEASASELALATR